jgi:hypothetical protein
MVFPVEGHSPGVRLGSENRKRFVLWQQTERFGDWPRGELALIGIDTLAKPLVMPQGGNATVGELQHISKGSFPGLSSTVS